MTVYNKAGKAVTCSKEDAEILIKSGHFSKRKPKS